MEASKKSKKGHIILVQEDRFRMVDDLGRGYLFTLSHKARTGEKDLRDWHNSNMNVIVRYSGDPNLATGVAHEVEPYA